MNDAECPVCGMPTETPGWQGTCGTECAGLFFIRPQPGMDRDSCALVAWAWRARRAAVRGVEFTEPAPKSEAERSLDVLLPTERAA